MRKEWQLEVVRVADGNLDLISSPPEFQEGVDTFGAKAGSAPPSDAGP